MKQVITTVCLTVALVVAGFAADTNVAYAKRVLQIDNDSGETVYQLYAVSTDCDDWGEDILVNPSTFPNNHYQIVYFSDDVRYVKIKACFSDGRYEYCDSIDLDRVSYISLMPYDRL